MSSIENDRRSLKTLKRNKLGLLIEDSIEISQMYSDFFESRDVSVDIASSLDESMERLSSQTYDFVLLDGEFPTRSFEVPVENHHNIVSFLNSNMIETHHRPILIHIPGLVDRKSIYWYLVKGQVDFYFNKPNVPFSYLGDVINGFAESGISYGYRDSDTIKANKALNEEMYYMEKESSMKNFLNGGNVYFGKNEIALPTGGMGISTPLLERMLKDNPGKFEKRMVSAI